MRDEEIINTIYQLNQDIDIMLNDDETGLTFVTDGFCGSINFLGTQIWNEDMDDRAYLNETEGILESLDEFLIREMNKKFERISKLKLVSENL